MKKKILTCVFCICIFCLGLGIGAVAVSNVLLSILEEYKKSAEKSHRLFQLISQWLRLKQEGKSINNYFEKNNYRNIAIYGKGAIGESVEKELVNSNINIKYFIDQKADKKMDRFMVSPSSELEKVDVIVVTPILSYGEIKQQLVKKVDFPIVSIEDILFEV